MSIDFIDIDGDKEKYLNVYNLDNSFDENSNMIFDSEDQNMMDDFNFENDFEKMKENTGFIEFDNNSKKNEIITINNKSTVISTKKEKIFSINKIKKINKKLGRKKLTDNKETKVLHDKYSFDNTVRKIKAKLFNAILAILNKSLEQEENNNNTQQRKRKIKVRNGCFLKIEQKTIINTNIKDNLELLNTTLKKIFSRDVGKKVANYSIYGENYNINLIKKIEENNKKYKNTNDILNMTLFQCLEHFRKSEYYEELSGLELEYDNIINEMKKTEEENYVDSFKAYLDTYEKRYENKRPKNKKAKKKENDH
jgi:hypothetical protein